MIRRNLEHIPSVPFPKGFTIRPYQPGDELIWQEIQSRSDNFNQISTDTFWKAFGDNREFLIDRQFYVVNRNFTVVATGTSWFNNAYKNFTFGRIHWLAVLPENQRKGLGKALLTFLCQKLKSLGHDKVYLTTSTLRIQAINLYLGFGFYPEIRNQEDCDTWNIIRDKLKYPIHIE